MVDGELKTIGDKKVSKAITLLGGTTTTTLGFISLSIITPIVIEAPIDGENKLT